LAHVRRVEHELVNYGIEIKGALTFANEQGAGLISNTLVGLDLLEVLMSIEVGFVLGASCVLELVLHGDFVDSVLG
jgi:hypothetical protein